METWVIVLLVIGSLILIAGIIRVITKPFEGILELLLELLFLDVIFSALGAIFEGLSDGL